MYWFPAKKSTETMWEFILICMCKKSHQCVKIWIPKPCIKLTWNFHLPDIQRILFNVSMIHTKVSQTVTDVCNVTYTKRWWIKKKKKHLLSKFFFFKIHFIWKFKYYCFRLKLCQWCLILIQQQQKWLKKNFKSDKSDEQLHSHTSSTQIMY